MSCRVCKLIILKILLIIIVIPLTYSQEAGTPFVRVYPPKEYGKPPQIFASVQDSKGLMYFSSYKCVLEYDGKNWTPIVIEGISAVYALAIDKKDRIFVGAKGYIGYIQAGNPGKKKMH